MGFQSLLSWIGFKDLGWKCGAESVGMRFQSLLSWIGFKDFVTYRTTKGNVAVSILVVVDWVQRQRRADIRAAHLMGFNPCCRGLGSKTCREKSLHDVEVVVSILVVVDWVQRLWSFVVAARIFRKFQSLLSWIGFKDPLPGLKGDSRELCFNPCCRGLGSKTAGSSC